MAGLYSLLRPLLFQLEPETAHRLTLGAIGLLGRIHPINQYLADAWRGSLPAIPVEAMGLCFPNPVGLAAGLDKHAQAVDGLASLGFGFLELGTVTPLPQTGNPRPRMFRLAGAQALINRMGFNSEGLNHFLHRLGQQRQQAVIGINLGRNATTDNDDAWRDYLTGLRAVYRIADYVTINISSPNTKGLRDLQERETLDGLLQRLKDEQAQLADLHGKYTPIAVKISPDLDTDAIGPMAEVLVGRGIDGIVASNTTTSRPLDLKMYPKAAETGGLSGAPLATLSHRLITELRQHTPSGFPLIGVGGIMDAASAQAAFSAGATLIQVYSGLIYRGPGLLRDILKALEAAASTDSARA
ncbi:MAG: dihydroorotate dehydrogenase (quinone) [Acidiferrobacteraceae bacterium]|jgi:dihydroorotate dehydrogenase|nr:dihydroorotate dehydrogenase (quinone) [Acidiferrobacteraceae bacterium]MDP6397895.1 quinone-dependent dihydroorotate dehydrogenase [Arenicellales bacterium]MDP6550879.1 quinone-dependent dihydroorotate dehydrogenase [Arenicellales bacterium]MDP6790745.1 quinone-dependent dihydroorotate dehydrogenase [Arenicellales bacterium]MDP6917913.1 quinone-dependent dihydroorotate dehydrogenase [Arenicellales bacterium]|tara:strand:- start:8758 stop:9825 length:1068 start_codon:yes stop_codon:yes gene_type:complete